MSQRNHFALKHGLLTSQIALNALVGYLFAKMLASRFGTSAEKDVFDIAYAIPFIILNVGGFAFAHAVVTSHFSKLLASRPHRLQPLFSTTVTCVILGTTLLAAPFAVLVEPLGKIFAPGIEPELRAEFQQLMLWLLPIVFSFSLCTLFSAVSTAYGVPVSNELGPLVARLIVLTGLLVGVVGDTLPQIAIALTTSSLAGLLMQWYFLHHGTLLRIRFSFDFRDRDFQNMARQAAGFFLAACLAQLAVVYLRRLASLDTVGTNAAITYALSLLSPFGLLIGKPLSLVTGPRFAGFFATGNTKQARALLDRTVLGCLTIGFATAAVVNLFAEPLVRLLFGGGQFDAHAARATADLLSCVVWSLPGSVVLWVVLMPLIAVSRSHRPAAIYCAGYLLQILFMSLFFPIWGRYALVWGYALGVSFQAALAWFVVYRAIETPVVEVPLELAC